MTQEEQLRYYSGVDEVELTNEVIEEILKLNLWGNRKSLEMLRDEGGKWNTRRHSVTFPPEAI
tara:strand:- start:128 stop:316 length:189 start_codon:yes stop_codon:yes gene_type:complete